MNLSCSFSKECDYYYNCLNQPDDETEQALMKLVNDFARKIMTGPAKWPILAAMVLLLGLVLIYLDVESGQYSIYQDVASVPPEPAAIVFGAGIDSMEAHDRVSTAAALYKAGKVRKLLMTGDNGHVNYNEPESMKKDAISLGVPASDITCDYAGFRTYDSLYRAREIFEVRNAILVSQNYHLPRAMFLAQRLGLNVVGMAAGKKSYGLIQKWYNLREVGAAIAAWFDILTERKSKFLGKKEPIFPHGEFSVH